MDTKMQIPALKLTSTDLSSCTSLINRVIDHLRSHGQTPNKRVQSCVAHSAISLSRYGVEAQVPVNINGVETKNPYSYCATIAAKGNKFKLTPTMQIQAYKLAEVIDSALKTSGISPSRLPIPVGARMEKVIHRKRKNHSTAVPTAADMFAAATAQGPKIVSTRYNLDKIVAKLQNDAAFCTELARLLCQSEAGTKMIREVLDSSLI
jgi:hypothetical protein